MGRAPRGSGSRGSGMKRGISKTRELSAPVTYLAMESRPKSSPPAPPLVRAALLKCENPPVHFYRYLYNTVGAPWYWIERRMWSDERLREHLANEKVALYALYIGGVPGGMAELGFPERKIAQLSHFRLMAGIICPPIRPGVLPQITLLSSAGTHSPL